MKDFSSNRGLSLYLMKNQQCSRAFYSNFSSISSPGASLMKNFSSFYLFYIHLMKSYCKQQLSYTSFELEIPRQILNDFLHDGVTYV